jgi:hypothetical protein
LSGLFIFLSVFYSFFVCDVSRITGYVSVRCKE